MTTIDERAVWTVWAWGANNCGQLGCGHRDDLLVPTPFALSDILNPDLSGKGKLSPESESGSHPLYVAGSKQGPVIQSTGGGAFSVLLTETGQILTCGKNDRGQLGQGSRKSEDGQEIPMSACTFTLTDSASTKIIQVQAGWDFVLALTDTGTILSWGSNSFGQLGRILPQGVKMDSTPEPVSASKSSTSKFVSVAAGLRHALAVTDNGLVYSWGSGRKGQLGVIGPEGKSLPSSTDPVLVPLTDCDKPVKAVAGMNFSGILTDKGSVFLWGCNKYGQCGIDNTSEIMLPSPRCLRLPTEVSTVVSVAAGWTHGVFRTGSGKLYSWGRADLGQLGRSTDDIPQHTPGLVNNVTTITHHCCSSEHNLALTDKGQVYSWGWNEHGICGTGDENNVFVPQLIPRLLNETAMSVGCGAGHCFCWTVKDGDSST